MSTISWLYSRFESELQRIKANRGSLVISSRTWSFNHGGGVSVVRNVDFRVVLVRYPKALPLVRSQLLKLAFEFVGVGRG